MNKKTYPKKDEKNLKKERKNENFIFAFQKKYY